MNNAKVIIGAGYGDEGKGLATDFLAAEHGGNTTVVRYNGGAQAGHTVEAPGGVRHVFSHFSSASLVGAATYLSRFFVCHPMLFHAERHTLSAIGVEPRVMVDPMSPVSTPYDVMINQSLEKSRGSGRHGSCGIGFGETLERQENSPFSLHVQDLLGSRGLADKLTRIRDHYTAYRLRELSLPPLSAELRDDSIMQRFIDDALDFAECVELRPIEQVARHSELIFEGAQGLSLDMARGCFPYVTRSNTGLKNVAALAAEAKLGGLDVCYVTRAYTTRHGAGPLPRELSEAPYAGIEDATNINNSWQGSLRFAWLDLDALAGRVHADLADGAGLVTSTSTLVTCLDQIQGCVRFYEGGVLHCTSPEEQAQRIASVLNSENLLASFGPTRSDVCRVVRPRLSRSA